ncbi:MAG: arylamine N-acetyltransferase, partial [Oscillospiraceae bacterium]|nr:arylamine N-acetyltransferase [Oscillospiraceae bacterium]
MSGFYGQMYGKYLEDVPDKEAYLERIGLKGAQIPLTKEGLDKLQWAQLRHVPFENVDIYDYGVHVDFGIAELFEKIVVHKRGGYCYELNSLFMALLKGLGFEVFPIGVRIIMGGNDDYIPAISHRGSIVTIDGKRYFADVGFGMTNAPGASICIDDYDRQDIRGQAFTVEDRPYNNKMIIMQTEAGPSNLFRFVPEPFQIADFVTYNTFMAMTGWRAKRIANLRTDAGAISV